MDALYQPGCGLDVETASGSYDNPTQVVTCFFASRYYRPHEVPRLEPEGTLAAGQVSMREAALGELCTLIAAASCALDFQRRCQFPKLVRQPTLPVESFKPYFPQ